MKFIVYTVFFFFFQATVFSQTGLLLGRLAPEITLKDQSGQTIKLSDNFGSLTIVHFWASWSKACKPMNQFLSQNYSRYNREGLKIFSVSVDKKARPWFDAIDKQKLNWPLHVSDFKGLVYSNPAKDYKIYEVPSIFLVDENGVVIMENPSQDDLYWRLRSLETDLKMIPNRSSNFIFLTKRVEYRIYDSEDTLVMGGRGTSVSISTLDAGEYRVEAAGEIFSFTKVIDDLIYDFQIDYQKKKVMFAVPCVYEIRSGNGNLLVRGKGEFVDYSQMEVRNKEEYYLILPNSAHILKLY